MLISLDFDETFTRTPFFWRDFYRMCNSNNVDLICVTYRPECDIEFVRTMLDIHDVDIPIFCTGGSAKQEFMEKKNINVDIWVDDDPSTIIMHGL